MAVEELRAKALHCLGRGWLDMVAREWKSHQVDVDPGSCFRFDLHDVTCRSCFRDPAIYSQQS